MNHAAFAAAAQSAKAQAQRQGKIIHSMKWDEKAQHLSWEAHPKKEAMKLASGSEIVFQGKGGEIVSLELGAPEAPKGKRGISQGQLI